MKKTSIMTSIVVLLILAAGIVYLTTQLAGSKSSSTAPGAFNGKNSTFIMNGTPVTLENGLSQKPAAPGSKTTVTVRYFGNEAVGDLNGDGLPDTAYLVTQNSGGSATFYYAVVALKNETGFTTTNAFFIGDRIAPQSTEIHADSKELRVNFADRKPGEAFTTPPSVGATGVLKVTPAGVLKGLMK